MNSLPIHTFHIPVMGIGFTIDTPVKVAHYGISSALSLVDDMLMEKLREFYCNKLDMPFQGISNKIDDYRAKRITSYLDLLDTIVKDKFTHLKHAIIDKREELEKYYELLPELSEIKQKIKLFLDNITIKEDFVAWIHQNLYPGSIDVNIMTKLDKENSDSNGKLPVEFNDAHAALRGFANSQLDSSLILSAGMNPRLYAYLESFNDFYPDENSYLKKKIILKVSDFRSAMIQGKFLAKKGIWISEYRIESGLNCGGHAFATDGFLMGPILEEFKNERGNLITTIHEILVDSLKKKNAFAPVNPLPVRFTAQGGVGTNEEHEFLLNYYDLDSIGWGSPFLLVPEVSNVDEKTLKLLAESGEEDLYTSNISPLGVPFNTIRGNSKSIEKIEKAKSGKPGSACPKKYASLSTEFTKDVICRASRQYQKLKINELDTRGLSADQYQKEYDRIIEVECICVGLGTSSLLVNGIETKIEGTGVSICPGPNIASFTQIVSLKNMVDHIYGRTSLIRDEGRLNLFLRELTMYVDYLRGKSEDLPETATEKQIEYLHVFRSNLNEGIQYYKNQKKLFRSKLSNFKEEVLLELHKELNSIKLRNPLSSQTDKSSLKQMAQ
jgi:hypothetical protein